MTEAARAEAYVELWVREWVSDTFAPSVGQAPNYRAVMNITNATFAGGFAAARETALMDWDAGCRD